MDWNDEIDDLEHELSEPDPCDHEDFEVDILDGRCWCDRCGHRWYATNEQVEAQIEHQRAYDEWETRENRWQWWRDLVAPGRAFFSKLSWWICHREKIADDDIPF